MASATDKQHLEHKAIDAINEFLNKNDDVSIYLEDLMEDLDWDPQGSFTEAEMEIYANQLAAVKMKLLAKVIGVL